MNTNNNNNDTTHNDNTNNNNNDNNHALIDLMESALATQTPEGPPPPRCHSVLAESDEPWRQQADRKQTLHAGQGHTGHRIGAEGPSSGYELLSVSAVALCQIPIGPGGCMAGLQTEPGIRGV